MLGPSIQSGDGAAEGTSGAEAVERGFSRVVSLIGGATSRDRTQPELKIPHVLPIAAVVSLGCLALLGVAAMAAARFDRPFGDFTRDPVTVLAESSCTTSECTMLGFVSSIGGLVWIVSAGICLFALLVLRIAANRPALGSPYLYLGILTTILVLDDEFLLHETPHASVPWLNEKTMFALYAIFGLATLLVFRRFLARTSAWLLGLAIGSLSLSVGIDLFSADNFAAEDGAKLLGIALWTTFLAGTAMTDVGKAITAAADPIPEEARTVAAATPGATPLEPVDEPPPAAEQLAPAI